MKRFDKYALTGMISVSIIFLAHMIGKDCDCPPPQNKNYDTYIPMRGNIPRAKDYDSQSERPNWVRREMDYQDYGRDYEQTIDDYMEEEGIDPDLFDEYRDEFE